MKIGFDNEKYLKMQSEHIRERINQFDNKLVDAVADVLGLHFQVFFIVKSNFHGIFLPFFHGICLKETDHSCRDDAKFSPLGSEELQTTDFILL